MTGLKVTLTDGSFHPVDSDQLSFELVAHQAFKVLCPEAGPVLMEPIIKVEFVTPEENMGDLIGDLNKRRGLVQGMEEGRSGARIVTAMVPLPELLPAQRTTGQSQLGGSYHRSKSPSNLSLGSHRVHHLTSNQRNPSVQMG